MSILIDYTLNDNKAFPPIMKNGVLICTITHQNHKETDFSELIGKCARTSGESKKWIL